MATMFSELTENPLRRDTPSRVKALLVMERQRREPLLEVLECCRADLLLAHDIAEAKRILQNRPPVQVLLTALAPPSKDWAETKEILALLPEHVQIVVCCARGDVSKQWIAALDFGAYDALIEPYDRDEVQQVLEGAANRSHMRYLASRHRPLHPLWMPEEETTRF